MLQAKSPRANRTVRKLATHRTVSNPPGEHAQAWRQIAAQIFRLAGRAGGLVLLLAIYRGGGIKGANSTDDLFKVTTICSIPFQFGPCSTISCNSAISSKVTSDVG
jgi:hypothetical protein